MSVDTLQHEVDMERLNLRPHPWEWWWVRNGTRWHEILACPMCGAKYEHHWQLGQICLGIIGELMLAGEKVPTRWSHDFDERRRLGRRAWRKKASK